jgi:hypothetical protein
LVSEFQFHKVCIVPALPKFISFCLRFSISLNTVDMVRKAGLMPGVSQSVAIPRYHGQVRVTARSAGDGLARSVGNIL